MKMKTFKNFDQLAKLMILLARRRRKTKKCKHTARYNISVENLRSIHLVPSETKCSLRIHDTASFNLSENSCIFVILSEAFSFKIV